MVLAFIPNRGVPFSTIGVGENGIAALEMLIRQIAIHANQTRLGCDDETGDSGDVISGRELTDLPALRFPRIVNGDGAVHGPLTIRAGFVGACSPIRER